MSATVYPTQDGNFIATCQITGKGASGRTRQHALRNLLSSASPASQAADEKSLTAFNKRGEALLSGQE
jgi:hypothetical protein